MIVKTTVLLMAGLAFVVPGCVQTITEDRPAAYVDQKRAASVTPAESGSPLPDEKEKNMSENVLAKVKMKASAEVAGDSLVISYEVENSADNDVYLWDGTIGFEGNTKVVDPNRVYVFFEEPGTALIIRANLPLPRLRRITRKQILFARLLKGNSTLKGRTVLPLPLVEHSPYYEPPKEGELEPKKCSRVRLMIGWTTPKAGMKILEKDINGEKWFSISGAWQQPYQEVLEQFIPLNLELLTYTSKFERQLPLR